MPVVAPTVTVAVAVAVMAAVSPVAAAKAPGVRAEVEASAVGLWGSPEENSAVVAEVVAMVVVVVAMATAEVLVVEQPRPTS